MPNCEARITSAMTSRMVDLKCMFRPEETNSETLAEFLTDMGIDLPELAEGETYDDHEDTLRENAREEAHNYGLAFDYVLTETDDKPPYWRYQISWGGPSEELRFYHRGYSGLIQFWYLDWFDGAGRTLHGDERATAQALFDWFDDCGTVDLVRSETEAAA